jgi:hypothetical protein
VLLVQASRDRAAARPAVRMICGGAWMDVSCVRAPQNVGEKLTKGRRYVSARNNRWDGRVRCVRSGFQAGRARHVEGKVKVGAVAAAVSRKAGSARCWCRTGFGAPAGCCYIFAGLDGPEEGPTSWQAWIVYQSPPNNLARLTVPQKSSQAGPHSITVIMLLPRPDPTRLMGFVFSARSVFA